MARRRGIEPPMRMPAKHSLTDAIAAGVISDYAGFCGLTPENMYDLLTNGFERCEV